MYARFLPGQQYVGERLIDGIKAGTVVFMISIISIYPQITAVFLGQTNQLVLIGICRTIMATFTKQQLMALAILEQVRQGRLTLQNLDALLHNDFSTAKSGHLTRDLILFLMTLPLILSASCKMFVGGSSTVMVTGVDGANGLIGPPGYQKIGMGTSLIVNLYLPFWNDPRFPQTYGYNLFMASNSTAAVLDAPLPSYISHIQNGLAGDEVILSTVNVNATVTTGCATHATRAPRRQLRSSEPSYGVASSVKLGQWMG